jgi:glycosyltransferase involved in cell wall biosynthesis
MNIYFAGTMQSTFIQQDADLLSENHKLTIFDFSKHTASFSNIHKFLFYSACEWNNVRKSDVVVLWFADYIALPFIIWAKLFCKPIITHVGGWEVYSAPEINYGNQLNPIRGAATRWILRNSNICVVPSKSYQQITKKVESESNVVVIPNSIDTGLCESPLPIKNGVVTALTSMKFTRLLKGIPTFEKATQGMNSKIIENVPHHELIKILKVSKVYCQLSYTESFGVTLVEAMACGCIPVVADRDALPEIVGECGYIVPYGDVRETRRCIQHALSRSNPDIQSIRDRAKLFSREREKTIVEEVLQKLCINH